MGDGRNLKEGGKKRTTCGEAGQVRVERRGGERG